jgi:hypothetical protein
LLIVRHFAHHTAGFQCSLSVLSHFPDGVGCMSIHALARETVGVLWGRTRLLAEEACRTGDGKALDCGHFLQGESLVT